MSKVDFELNCKFCDRPLEFELDKTKLWKSYKVKTCDCYGRGRFEEGYEYRYKDGINFADQFK